MTRKGQTRTVVATVVNVRSARKRTFIVRCGYDRESPAADIRRTTHVACSISGQFRSCGATKFARSDPGG